MQIIAAVGETLETVWRNFIFILIILSECTIYFTYNHFHISRLFDILPNSPFTISEMICRDYLQTWYIRVSSRVAERLKILGNKETLRNWLNFIE